MWRYILLHCYKRGEKFLYTKSSKKRKKRKSIETSGSENQHLAHTHHHFSQASQAKSFQDESDPAAAHRTPSPWIHSPCTDICGRAADVHSSTHFHLGHQGNATSLLCFHSFVQIEHQTLTFQSLKETYQLLCRSQFQIVAWWHLPPRDLGFHMWELVFFPLLWPQERVRYYTNSCLQRNADFGQVPSSSSRFLLYRGRKEGMGWGVPKIFLAAF